MNFFAVVIVLCICILGDGLSGIDLGSQNIVAGVVGGKSSFEVVTSESGKRTTPSVVTIDGIRRYAGQQAIDKQLRLFNQTFTNIVNHLGREKLWDTPEHAVPIPTGNYTRNNKTNRLFFANIKYNQTVYPEELAAYLLHNVKKRVENVSGTSITNYVISVPAYFTQAQRIAVLDAAEIARINVVALVESNVASAFWYGTERSRTMPLNVTQLKNIIGDEEENLNISAESNVTEEQTASSSPSESSSPSFFSRMKNFVLGKKESTPHSSSSTNKWTSFKAAPVQPNSHLIGSSSSEGPLIDIRHIIFVDVGANQISFTLAEYQFLIEETEITSGEGKKTKDKEYTRGVGVLDIKYMMTQDFVGGLRYDEQIFKLAALEICDLIEKEDAKSTSESANPADSNHETKVGKSISSSSSSSSSGDTGMCSPTGHHKSAEEKGSSEVAIKNAIKAYRTTLEKIRKKQEIEEDKADPLLHSRAEADPLWLSYYEMKGKRHQAARDVLMEKLIKDKEEELLEQEKEKERLKAEGKDDLVHEFMSSCGESKTPNLDNYQFPPPENPQVCEKVLSSPSLLLKLSRAAQKGKEILSVSPTHVIPIEDPIKGLSEYRYHFNRSLFEEKNLYISKFIEESVRKFLKEIKKLPTLSTSSSYILPSLLYSSSVFGFPVSSIPVLSVPLNMSAVPVELLGGATRTPSIQALLQKVFYLAEIGNKLNLDESAALGATMYAHLNRAYFEKVGDKELREKEKEEKAKEKKWKSQKTTEKTLTKWEKELMYEDDYEKRTTSIAEEHHVDIPRFNGSRVDGVFLFEAGGPLSLIRRNQRDVSLNVALVWGNDYSEEEEEKEEEHEGKEGGSGQSNDTATTLGRNETDGSTNEINPVNKKEDSKTTKEKPSSRYQQLSESLNNDKIKVVGFEDAAFPDGFPFLTPRRLVIPLGDVVVVNETDDLSVDRYSDLVSSQPSLHKSLIEYNSLLPPLPSSIYLNFYYGSVSPLPKGVPNLVGGYKVSRMNEFILSHYVNLRAIEEKKGQWEFNKVLKEWEKEVKKLEKEEKKLTVVEREEEEGGKDGEKESEESDEKKTTTKNNTDPVEIEAKLNEIKNKREVLMRQKPVNDFVSSIVAPRAVYGVLLEVEAFFDRFGLLQISSVSLSYNEDPLKSVSFNSSTNLFTLPFSNPSPSYPHKPDKDLHTTYLKVDYSLSQIYKSYQCIRRKYNKTYTIISDSIVDPLIKLWQKEKKGNNENLNAWNQQVEAFKATIVNTTSDVVKGEDEGNNTKEENNNTTETNGNAKTLLNEFTAQHLSPIFINRTILPLFKPSISTAAATTTRNSFSSIFIEPINTPLPTHISNWRACELPHIFRNNLNLTEEEERRWSLHPLWLEMPFNIKYEAHKHIIDSDNYYKTEEEIGRRRSLLESMAFKAKDKIQNLVEKNEEEEETEKSVSNSKLGKDEKKTETNEKEKTDTTTASNETDIDLASLNISTKPITIDDDFTVPITGEVLLKVSTQEERDNLLNISLLIVDWLETADAMDVTLTILDEKFYQLRNASYNLTMREIEANERPHIVRLARQRAEENRKYALEMLAKFLKTQESISKEEDEELKEENITKKEREEKHESEERLKSEAISDIQKVLKEITNFTEWLNKTLEEQRNLSLLENPVVKYQDIIQHEEDMENNIKQILKASSDKRKKESKKSEKKKKEKKQKDKESGKNSGKKEEKKKEEKENEKKKQSDESVNQEKEKDKIKKEESKEHDDL